MYALVYTLKAKYEQELVLAQAKVEVINDLIALSKECECQQATAAAPVVEVEPDLFAETDGNY